MLSGDKTEEAIRFHIFCWLNAPIMVVHDGDMRRDRLQYSQVPAGDKISSLQAVEGVHYLPSPSSHPWQLH